MCKKAKNKVILKTVLAIRINIKQWLINNLASLLRARDYHFTREKSIHDFFYPYSAHSNFGWLKSALEFVAVMISSTTGLPSSRISTGLS